jgi:DNA replication protein DnaC
MQKPNEICEICGERFEYNKRPDAEKVVNTVFDLGPQAKSRLMWEQVPHSECETKLENQKQQKQDLERYAGRRGEIKRAFMAVRRRLPHEASEKTFANFKALPENQQTVDRAFAWGEKFDFPWGLFFIGPTGTGKTHLMLALFNLLWDRREEIAKSEKIDSNNVIEWFAWPDLNRQITHEQTQEGHFTTFELVRQCHFLFLDDVGAMKTSEYNRDTLYSIIEHRKNFGLPTIASCNLTSEEMNQTFHARILSRLKESTLPLVVKGEDFRSNFVKSHMAALDNLTANRPNRAEV